MTSGTACCGTAGAGAGAGGAFDVVAWVSNSFDEGDTGRKSCNIPDTGYAHVLEPVTFVPPRVNLKLFGRNCPFFPCSMHFSILECGLGKG